MKSWDDSFAGSDVNTKIADAILRLTGEYTGRMPTYARTAIGEDIITVLLEDTMTKGERKLLDDGRADFVLDKRRSYQQLMRDDMVDAVELLSARTVIAFMSDHHLGRDMAVEVFVLEPPFDPAAAE